MQPRLSSSTMALVAGLWMAPLANAQFSTDFENINVSTAGVNLNGQGGWHQNPPVPTTSVTFKAYLAFGNALNIPLNPTGGAKFVAGTGPAGGVYARSQRKIAYCGDKFTSSFDVLALFLGTGTPGNNLGSVSLQPSSSAKIMIQLLRWDVVGSTWKVTIIAHTAAGGTATYFDVPGTGFTGLKLNKWYRYETDFDLKTNQITEVRLTDIVAKTTVKHVPTGWYLYGGSASTLPRPTGIRMFAGGGVAGNTLAFDNVSMTLNEPGKKAVATVYGSGTGRPNPKGSLVVTGAPVIDTTVVVGLHNPLTPPSQPAGSPTALYLGLGKIDPGAMIPGFGMTGGNGELLITTLLVAIPGPPWNGSTPSNLPLVIPPSCTLVGLSVYAQGIIVDPSTGAKAPIALTEGLGLLFGNIK